MGSNRGICSIRLGTTSIKGRVASSREAGKTIQNYFRGTSRNTYKCIRLTQAPSIVKGHRQKIID